MQDHRVGLYPPHRSPLNPRRAEQDEPSIAALDVHRNGPPWLDPMTTWGLCLSNSSWAIWTASSGSLGLKTVWPWSLRKVGLTPPATEVQPWRKRILIGNISSMGKVCQARLPAR